MNVWWAVIRVIGWQRTARTHTSHSGVIVRLAGLVSLMVPALASVSCPAWLYATQVHFALQFFSHYKAMFTWRVSTRCTHEIHLAFTWQPGLKKKTEKCMSAVQLGLKRLVYFHNPFSENRTGDKKTACWIICPSFQSSSCKHTATLNPGWLQLVLSSTRLSCKHSLSHTWL